MKLLKTILCLSAALVISGCATMAQKPDEQTFYKRDMKLTVNGQTSDGVMVVPSANEYDIEIEAKGNLDLLDWNSCHRGRQLESAGQDGIFGNKRKAKWKYIPVAGIENVGDCPIDLGGYAVSGKHSWAFIDFENPELALSALNKCNGKTISAKGVGICQSKEGLIQRLELPEPVMIGKQKDTGCFQMPGQDGVSSFEYHMGRGQCVHTFLGIKSKAKFRLSTIGYEKVLVRGD